MPPPEIPIPKGGPDEWLESIRAIVTAIKAGWVVDGKGTKVSDAAGGGRSVNTAPPADSTTEADSLGQLQTYNATDESATKVGVTVGQFFSGGSWIPEIDGAPLNADPTPLLTVSPTDTLVILGATLNALGVVVANSDVVIFAADALPASDDTHVYISLAAIVVTSGEGASVAVSPLVGGSLTHSRCTEWFTFPITYSHQIGRV